MKHSTLNYSISPLLSRSPFKVTLRSTDRACFRNTVCVTKTRIGAEEKGKKTFDIHGGLVMVEYRIKDSQWV